MSTAPKPDSNPLDSDPLDSNPLGDQRRPGDSQPAAATATGRAGSVGSPMSAQQVLEREFLEMRARVLKLAASLDRLDRSPAPAADAGQLQLIRDGIQILLSDGSDRAQRVQLLFSRPYSAQWPSELDVPVTRKS